MQSSAPCPRLVCLMSGALQTSTFSLLDLLTRIAKGSESRYSILHTFSHIPNLAVWVPKEPTETQEGKVCSRSRSRRGVMMLQIDGGSFEG